MKIKNLKLKISASGFTLIELLVVIVIIGVLTALILANFVGIRQRARDGQRKADMRQIQAALELYRSDNGSYPTAVSCTDGDKSIKSGETIYLRTVPCDPLDRNSYRYNELNNRTRYTLVGCLENDKDGQKDVLPNPDISCPENRYSITYQNP